MRPGLTILSILFIFSITSCGYYLVETGEAVGVEIESLAIPLMTSTSSTIGFEADFTSIVRAEFITHSKIPILSVEEARMVLTGHIYDITAKPMSYNIVTNENFDTDISYETTNSRQLTVKLDAKLTDSVTGEVIWHSKSLQASATYSLSLTDPVAEEYNQKQALITIANILSKTLYQKTMERF